jgi:hypothetical protein
LYVSLVYKSFYKILLYKNNTKISTNIFWLIVTNKLFINKGVNAYNVNETIFSLPKKKHKFMFLRAPYKNKLARLSLLNYEYSYKISYGLLKGPIEEQTEKSILILFKKFNFDYMKLKHVKTHIYILKKPVNAFLVKNYN